MYTRAADADDLYRTFPRIVVISCPQTAPECTRSRQIQPIPARSFSVAAQQAMLLPLRNCKQNIAQNPYSATNS